MYLYTCVKQPEPPRQKVLNNIAHVNFAPGNGGNPKAEHYTFKLFFSQLSTLKCQMFIQRETTHVFSIDAVSIMFPLLSMNQYPKEFL